MSLSQKQIFQYHRRGTMSSLLTKSKRNDTLGTSDIITLKSCDFK